MLSSAEYKRRLLGLPVVENTPTPAPGAYLRETDTDSEDEEVPPQSLPWVVPLDENKVPTIDIEKPKGVVASISPPEYDWRRKTANGRRSRAHFTKWLIEDITDLTSQK